MFWEIFILALKTFQGLSILALISTQWGFHRNSSLSVTFQAKLALQVGGPWGGYLGVLQALSGVARQLQIEALKTQFCPFLFLMDFAPDGGQPLQMKAQGNISSHYLDFFKLNNSQKSLEESFELELKKKPIKISKGRRRFRRHSTPLNGGWD